MNCYSNFEVKEPMEHPIVEYVPQSSPKSDSDDSEEPEEDPEQECEEDPEDECEEDPEDELEEDQDVGSEEENPEDELEEDQDVGSEEENPEDELEEPEDELEEDQELGSEEEDPEEESSVEPSEESAEEPSESVSPDEDVSKEIASKPSSHGEIDGNDHPSGSNDNRLKENKRSLDATCDSDLFQVNQKKFRQEEVCKTEPDVAKQQDHTGSSGKRRRSRWDEKDGKTDVGNETGKRRKTRWSTEVSDLKMLGPIQFPDFVNKLTDNDADPKIQKLKLRLSELNSKLLSSELHDHRPEMQISPPKPESNNLGIRINMRKTKLREKLIAERRKVISMLIKKDPIFRAVPSYKPPKFFKKLYIPVKEYPTYNFIGIIIGPRGNTQKKLEQETGARIVLRGKGSAKQPDKKVDKSDDEDLHVLIEADDQKSLDTAVEKVEKLLIPVDEGMNDHKRAQLVELAKLKGTYKDGNVCSVCKQVGHKDYACPHQKSTFKMVITCAKCGSFSHPSSSCPVLTPNTKGKPSDTDLYVGYLPQGVDENRLRELFCPFGKITEVKVIMDRNTGLSKGYGFVKFESSIDAAMAVTHMHGLKMEGKMLAVRLAGRPPPPVALSQLPMHPGPPTAIYANVPSHLRHLPMYPGPTAAISANALNLRALPEPPGYMLPEAQSSFQINEGRFNRLVESKATDILPPVVSSHTSSQLASSFDSYYRYQNQIPLSSPGLTSQFPGDRVYPGSQLLPYSSTPPLKPLPPYHSSYTP